VITFRLFVWFGAYSRDPCCRYIEQLRIENSGGGSGIRSIDPLPTEVASAVASKDDSA
jgi:hypothetical protein